MFYYMDNYLKIKTVIVCDDSVFMRASAYESTSRVVSENAKNNVVKHFFSNSTSNEGQRQPVCKQV